MSKNSISGRFVGLEDVGVITIPLTDTEDEKSR